MSEKRYLLLVDIPTYCMVRVFGLIMLVVAPVLFVVVVAWTVVVGLALLGWHAPFEALHRWLGNVLGEKV